MSRPVVVGFDGSEAAYRALDWAAHAAASRGLPLRIVQVREPWAAEHPFTAAGGRPTLTERCTTMVLGSRGMGGFAGLVLGSVSHGVLHRAHCPVAVVRARGNAS